MIKAVQGKLTIPDDVRTRVREMFASGADYESIMRSVRDDGQFQAQTYKLLREECGLSYEEAKSTIHDSSTWADCRQAVEDLHDTAYEAAIEAGFVDVNADQVLEDQRKRA